MPSEVHVYFHAYLIKSVFFGTGVVTLSEAQEASLCRIYEAPILQKLGYSVKFPRDLMYAPVKAMGLGFLRPTTIITQLKAKLLVGNARIQSPTYDFFLVLHEIIQFQSGLSQNIASIDKSNKFWKSTWLDDAYNGIRSRGIRCKHDAWSFRKISRNTTLMDMAVRFTSNTTHLTYINTVRRYKRVIYPFELIGTDGRSRTSAYLQG